MTATFNPSFPSGLGQYDTHKSTGAAPHVLDEFIPPKSGTDYPLVAWGEIKESALFAQTVEKERARWFIPSTYAGHDARSHSVQRERGTFPLLAFDLDEGDHHIEVISAALVAVFGHDVAALVYSTRSSQPDDKKWRVLIPLATAIPGSSYQHITRAAGALLAQRGITIDDAVTRPGQISYLPNRGGFYDTLVLQGSPVILDAQHPVMVAAAEAEAKAAAAQAEALAEREASPRAAVGGGSVIEAFNQNHPITALLGHYGYVRAGDSDDWRSPHQTTPSYATRDYGNYWVSQSGSDAAAGLGRATASGARWGDAFDLFVAFNNGGDFGKAVAAAAQLQNRLHVQATDGIVIEGDAPDPMTILAAWAAEGPEPDLSQSGLAAVFVEKHEDDYRFDHDAGDWVRWTGTIVHAGVTAQCSTCHTQTDWAAATIDHTRFFALTGPHDVACTSCHTTANDFSKFTCYSCHEHQEADLIRKHLEEGIRNIDNCVACHRDAHAEGGEGGEGGEGDDD